MPKGLGNISGLVKQAQEMQKKMAEVQENLKNRYVEGSAGGGMVTATANGRQEVVKIKIDPQVVDPDDVEILEDLIVAAVSQAVKKAKELEKTEMNKVTGGMPIPGMM